MKIWIRSGLDTKYHQGSNAHKCYVSFIYLFIYLFIFDVQASRTNRQARNGYYFSNPFKIHFTSSSHAYEFIGETHKKSYERKRLVIRR